MFKFKIIALMVILALAGGCASLPAEPMSSQAPDSAVLPIPASAPAASPPPTTAPPPAPVPTAMSRGPAESKSELYPLWYATNRKPSDLRNESKGYSVNSDKKTHYGKILVQIPTDFLAHLRTRNWFQTMISDSPESTLGVRNRVPMPPLDFMADLKAAIARNASEERYALIYIHGFQTTFDEAAQRAASIGYQIKAPTTALFSWPSKGKVAAYEADKNSMSASTDLLADFLIKVARGSGASKVHLIAHSMGSDALMQTMVRPVMQKAIADGLRFGQIILAAPDVDSRVFERDANYLAGISDRVTLYASSQDLALTASWKLARYSRAGLMPPPTLVSGVDTVDVSPVSLTMLGHSYVAGEIKVLEDINKLILHNDAPERRMRIQAVANGSYWKIQ